MHPLVARAQELSRRIYASLPWGYRVAGVMMHLASGVTDIVGRVAYAAFIKAGIEGLPPIRGENPDPAVHGNPEKLPPSYGKRFGERLYAALLSKIRNPDTVEEVLSRLMLKMTGTFSERLRPGAPLHSAEQYVMMTAQNLLKEHLRSEQGRSDRGQRRQMEDVDDLDLSDPSSFRHLDTMLPEHEIPRLMHELESVNKRAPGWLEAKLSGLSSLEIGEEWGIGKSSVSEWEKRYVPAIRSVMVKYIQAAA